jgi:hypothetical protein
MLRCGMDEKSCEGIGAMRWAQRSRRQFFTIFVFRLRWGGSTDNRSFSRITSRAVEITAQQC